MADRNRWLRVALVAFGVAHCGIMAVQALADPMERGHLPGDVAALFLVATVLGVLTPRGVTARLRQPRVA